MRVIYCGNVSGGTGILGHHSVFVPRGSVRPRTLNAASGTLELRCEPNDGPLALRIFPTAPVLDGVTGKFGQLRHFEPCDVLQPQVIGRSLPGDNGKFGHCRLYESYAVDLVPLDVASVGRLTAAASG